MGRERDRELEKSVCMHVVLGGGKAESGKDNYNKKIATIQIELRQDDLKNLVRRPHRNIDNKIQGDFTY